MKYTIAIIETLQTEIEVEAESEREALNKVEFDYDNCDIILDDSAFVEVNFEVIK